MADRVEATVQIDGAQLIFKNFEGKEGPYNKKGDKGFSVKLDDETAERMALDGWNVKWLEPREDDEEPRRQAFIDVAVEYRKGRPPKIYTITEDGVRTHLDGDTVEILDNADMVNVDLIIRPYNYDVNGKTGVKAYCQTMFVTIAQDALEQRYNKLLQQPANDLPA